MHKQAAIAQALCDLDERYVEEAVLPDRRRSYFPRSVAACAAGVLMVLGLFFFRQTPLKLTVSGTDALHSPVTLSAVQTRSVTRVIPLEIAPAAHPVTLTADAGSRLMAGDTEETSLTLEKPCRISWLLITSQADTFRLTLTDGKDCYCLTARLNRDTGEISLLCETIPSTQN